jgi:serine/threonine protein kinase
LYGYCLSDSQRKGEYLLYELAEKGSLDTFWNSQVGRERLSLFGRRANIALDAFIGIRFLHIGNKYIKPCFHRDIKSANIVLKSDMTAQLIDCGLATFAAQVDNDVNQTAMSTGVKGTRGYVCPKYCTGSISYDASCDIFSFGIVLAELWSGQLQNHRDANGRFYNFYEQYINEGHSMDEDLDKAFGFGIGDRIPPVMNEYKHLALDCMAKNPKKRPTGEEVMDRLEIVWHSFQINGSEQGTESGSRGASMEESESQSESSSTESSGEEAEGVDASDGAQAPQAVNAQKRSLKVALQKVQMRPMEKQRWTRTKQWMKKQQWKSQ